MSYDVSNADAQANLLVKAITAAKTAGLTTNVGKTDEAQAEVEVNNEAMYVNQGAEELECNNASSGALCDEATALTDEQKVFSQAASNETVTGSLTVNGVTYTGARLNTYDYNNAEANYGTMVQVIQGMQGDLRGVGSSSSGLWGLACDGFDLVVNGAIDYYSGGTAAAIAAYVIDGISTVCSVIAS
jgi:hypothetical protein